jgi:hypothetical protein
MDAPAAANSIELRIAEISQLFDSLDPFPFREKDLDKEAEEFIVSWARELPVDQPLKIVVHLPQAQASTPEAHELGAALTRYFDYRARGIGLDLNELFRVGRRALVIGVTVLSFSVIAGQTIAASVSPHPIGRVVEESLLISDGSRTGGQSKYFFTTGGRSFVDAIFTGDLRRPRWS